QVYAGYLIMVACLFTFVVFPITPLVSGQHMANDRNLNAFDFLLPLMVPAALRGKLKHDADYETRFVEIGDAHERTRFATRRMTRAFIAFYCLATVSLIP